MKTWFTTNTNQSTKISFIAPSLAFFLLQIGLLWISPTRQVQVKSKIENIEWNQQDKGTRSVVKIDQEES